MRSVLGRDSKGQLIDIPVAGETGVVDNGGAHDHDGSYAPVHAHPYAGTGHTHAGGDHPDLAAHTTLGLSTTSHDHTGTYSAAGHNHDASYAPTHAHPYAGSSHSHAIGDSTNLQASLDGKAASGHNHDAAYAGTGHTHPGGSEAFPVGAVFIAVVSTNPATLLGYGTWAAFGAGRVLVGLDAGDADFDTAEETGGAKTKSISAHAGTAVGNHAVTQPSAHADHTLSGAIAGEAAHTHAYTQTVNHVHPLATGTGSTGNFAQVIGTVDTSSGGTGGTPTQTALGTLSGNPSGGVASGTTAGGASHTHGNGTLTVSAHAAHTGTAVDAHAVTQPSAHSDLNVVQPYIVVFMWKRTA